MKKSAKITVIALIVSLPAAVALAGTTFSGTGFSIPDACSRAEYKAAEFARTRGGGCYESCDPNKCNQNRDGSWTCYATAANHRGSCG